MVGSSPVPRRRVLLVDDDPPLLEVLATVLGLEKFDVVPAADGDTALCFASSDHIDLAVCDVGMPGTDGLEVCRRLKADPRTADLPVILLTARSRERDRALGAQVGCDAYLAKPFSPLELLELMRAQPVRSRPLDSV